MPPRTSLRMVDSKSATLCFSASPIRISILRSSGNPGTHECGEFARDDGQIVLRDAAPARHFRGLSPQPPLPPRGTDLRRESGSAPATASGDDIAVRCAFEHAFLDFAGRRHRLCIGTSASRVRPLLTLSLTRDAQDFSMVVSPAPRASTRFRTSFPCPASRPRRASLTQWRDA